MAATRTAAAAIVSAGGRTDEAVRAAVDFVERCTGLDFDEARLLDDIGEPHLAIRLRGDVMLVAEGLTSSGTTELLAGMVRLAEVCERPGAALDVVELCRELLGVPPARRRRWWGA